MSLELVAGGLMVAGRARPKKTGSHLGNPEVIVEIAAEGITV
jgi:hypothetical protein